MSDDQHVFWDAVSNRLQSMLQGNGSAGTTTLRMGVRCSCGCASNAKQHQVCPTRPLSVVVTFQTRQDGCSGKLYARWLALRA